MPEEEAAEGARIRTKVQERSKHWHVCEEVQVHKTLGGSGAKRLRRSSSASGGEDSEESSCSMWVDECCEIILTMLHTVEMAGEWPTNASTTLFFPHSQKCQ